jgi:hypothetical protein
MATMRQYFDAKVPVAPGEGRPNIPGIQQKTWRQAWTELSKQLFVVMPNQLDRARVFRNRYDSAVD